MDFLVLYEGSDLTPAEERLQAAFSQGDPLDLGDAHTGGEADRSLPGDGRRLVRASFLRELLLSETSPPKGRVRQLSLSGADVHGALDLRFATIDFPIRLEHCRFDGPVTISEAQLRSVSLLGSTGHEIDARHVRVTGDLVLEAVRLTGRLRLSGAHLGDDLHLTGATLEPAAAPPASSSLPGDGVEGPLADLDNLEVKGLVAADDLTVSGTLSTDGASVSGTMRLRRARLGSPPGIGRGTGVAWWGDGLRVGGELVASGTKASGQVRLVDARVLSLVLKGVQIESASGTALFMDRLDSQGSVFCNEGATFTGGVHAIGVKVGGTLYLHGRAVAQPAQDGEQERVAVELRRSQLNGDLRCEPGFRALGAVAASGAHIGGSISLNGAALDATDESSLAFAGVGCRVDGNLRCAEGFSCRGAFNLVDAQVGGELVVVEETTSPGQRGQEHSTPVLAAGLRVGRDVRLRTSGVLDLSGADIAGDLTVDLDGLAGPHDAAAADLSGLTADVLTLNGRQRDGYLDLSHATVRLLLDNPAAWSGDAPPIVLDGLRYDDLSGPGRRDTKARIAWLEAGTHWSRRAERSVPDGAGTAPRYEEVLFTSQPYQQLASVYREAGQESDARDVMYQMFCRRNAVINRPHHRLAWLWNGTQSVFLGYGYRPSRAFAWVVLLVVASSLLFRHLDLVLSPDEQTNRAQDLGVVQAALLTLGLALPGSEFGQVEQWSGVNQPPTWAHYVAAVLVLVGLLLGATVIAALGRSVKR